MKAGDTSHRHIYICCHLCKIHYYSFIRCCWLENVVIVMLARTNPQYYSSSFFVQPGPAVGKLILLLPARPGALEEPYLISRRVPVHGLGRVRAWGEAWNRADL